VDEAIVKVLREDGATKAGHNFARVYAAPDDPTAIDEAAALSLVILGPATQHAGKGVGKSLATDAVTETLMRCRSSQRRYRNTLLFVAPDEQLLGTARDAMRKAIAWAEIAGDKRLQDQLPPAQMRDATEKAKGNREGAAKAVRLAWSHVLFPVKAAAAGVAFDLDHLSIASKDRAAIPVAVYEKAGPRGDGIAKERLGPDALTLHLKPLWPDDRSHLGITEVADWFASYAYLPKLRDRVVLETAIRDAVGKLDPAFGYADSFDEDASRYIGLAWAKSPPEIFPGTAVLVRSEVAAAQANPTPVAYVTDTTPPGSSIPGPGSPPSGTGVGGLPSAPSKPRRFYGTVELDMVRPVKAFDAVLNAVVMELQRTTGAKVKITVEIEAEAEAGA
jgi:GNAT superfamily N-acetyltransferase